jgi:hypothetical protein
MPFLASALDLEEMAARFSGELRGLGLSDRVHVPRASVMRYKPGRRCLIAYDIAANGPSETVRELAVVGKVRARGADVATHRVMRHLWKAGFGGGAADEIRIPEPLGLVPAIHMGVQRKVAGVPVGEILEGPQGIQIAPRVAEAVYKLHGANVPTQRRHSVEDEIQILRDRLGSVAEALPGWRRRIDKLIDGCVQMAAQVDTTLRCGIHRDFYSDQVLADGDRLYLLDLDLYCEGHPALDVGNFAAHIDEQSLRRYGDIGRLAGIKEALIERYLELSGATTRNDIDVFAALSLTRHVAISRQFAERQRMTESLLEVCEDRILATPCRR